MGLKLDGNRRSFLSAVGTMVGGFLAPNTVSASIFGKKRKPLKPEIDGTPIVPITSGLGSTGDIYAELGVTPLVNINGTVTVIGGSVVKTEGRGLIFRGKEEFFFN